MGLFSKLLGDELKKKGKELGAQLDSQLGSSLRDLIGGKPNNAAAQGPQSTVPAPARRNEPGPYDEIPAEENSFNYNGSYADYFDHVFREAFPEYEIVKEAGATISPSAVFTFGENGRRALVVEIMSESCSSKRLRAACGRAGIPYLRYYYDHDGWWNTKSYVIDRTRRALGR